MRQKERGGAIATPALRIIYASILLGMLSTAAMPVFVGGYVDVLHFSVAEAGRVASAESLGAAAGGILTALVLARPGVNLRNAIMVCFAALAAAHVASGLTSDLWTFGATRVVAGLAAGTLNAIGAVYISSLEKPDRAFAVSFGLLSVIGPLGLWCAPPLMATIGLSNVYFGYAAALVAGLPLMWFYPRAGEARGEVKAHEAAASPAQSLGVGLILLAILVNFICNGGVWIYAEQIGASAGLGAVLLGRLLAVAMALGVLGAVVVSVVEDRFGRMKPLVLAHAALGASILWLLTQPGASGYFLSILILNMSVIVLTPYFMATLSRASANGGRAAVLGNVTTMIGYGAGPGVLSFFVRGGDFHAAFVVAAAGVGVSLALTLAGGWLLNNARAQNLDRTAVADARG
ncbi:MFS transporter [Phenylobacterium sp.]|uniref:MFS transporter n=1 Tax=Phenylobacterium sp. TaxID=1871053 RepID=UPI0035AD9ED9